MARYKSPNGTGRVGRDKKKKAVESEEYKLTIESLAKGGIQPEWIEAIYARCQERKQTKISRFTLATKLLKLLEYFEERNESIEKDSNGYMESKDVVEMILRNPRIISSDINENIIAKCEIITEKNGGNIQEANEKIKNNPGIFRKKREDIEKGK